MTVSPVHPHTSPPTTALDDQSREMLGRAHDLAGAACEDLQNDVLELNLGMAHRLAHRYSNRGVADDDLEQVARMGLLKSVRRFDPERRSFDAYAVPTVLGELRRYFRDQAWSVRPTRQVQEIQASATKARDALRSRGNHEPTPREVADEVGATEADLRHAEGVQGAFTPRSLDAPTPSGDGTTGDLIGSEDPDLLRMERLQTAAPAVRRLGRDDRELLHMRFVEERTQQDIGTELGISQMQVSRRLSAVMRRIRLDLGLDAEGHDVAS